MKIKTTALYASLLVTLMLVGCSDIPKSINTVTSSTTVTTTVENTSDITLKDNNGTHTIEYDKDSALSNVTIGLKAKGESCLLGMRTEEIYSDNRTGNKYLNSNEMYFYTLGDSIIYNSEEHDLVIVKAYYGAIINGVSFNETVQIGEEIECVQLGYIRIDYIDNNYVLDYYEMSSNENNIDLIFGVSINGEVLELGIDQADFQAMPYINKVLGDYQTLSEAEVKVTYTMNSEVVDSKVFILPSSVDVDALIASGNTPTTVGETTD